MNWPIRNVLTKLFGIYHPKDKVKGVCDKARRRQTYMKKARDIAQYIVHVCACMRVFWGPGKGVRERERG